MQNLKWFANLKHLLIKMIIILRYAIRESLSLKILNLIAWDKKKILIKQVSIAPISKLQCQKIFFPLESL